MVFFDGPTWFKGELLKVTASVSIREAAVLAFMLTPSRGQHINGFLSHGAITSIFWPDPDDEPEGPNEVIRVTMSKLRRKFMPGIILRNLQCRGYEVYKGILSDPGPYLSHRLQGHHLLEIPSPQCEEIFVRLLKGPAHPYDLVNVADVNNFGDGETQEKTLRVLVSYLRRILRPGYSIEWKNRTVTLHKPQ